MWCKQGRHLASTPPRPPPTPAAAAAYGPSRPPPARPHALHQHVLHQHALLLLLLHHTHTRTCHLPPGPSTSRDQALRLKQLLDLRRGAGSRTAQLDKSNLKVKPEQLLSYTTFEGQKAVCETPVCPPPTDPHPEHTQPPTPRAPPNPTHTCLSLRPPAHRSSCPAALPVTPALAGPLPTAPPPPHSSFPPPTHTQPQLAPTPTPTHLALPHQTPPACRSSHQAAPPPHLPPLPPPLPAHPAPLLPPAHGP